MIKSLMPKTEFEKNVITLITGTAFAQAIPFFMTPILTRLYSPDDFGIFAIYLAIVSILAVSATGKYEQAIMLPKDNVDAASVAVLSGIISIIVSVVLLAIVVLFHDYIVELIGNAEIGSWLYFIPFSVLLTGIYQSFSYWNNRLKRYKNLAINRTIQSGGSSLSQTGLGLQTNITGGLIFGSLLGQLLSILSLLITTWKSDEIYFAKVTKLNLRIMAKRYIKFPQFLVFAHMLNVAAFQIPVMLITNMFSTVITGFYFLTQKMLGTPLSIISNAVGDVFRQEASVELQVNNSCETIYIKTLKKLSISVIPFTIVYYYLPSVFSFTFGSEWVTSGQYAQILLPMYFFSFICAPLSNMFMLREKQKLDLYFQIFFMFTSLIPFLLHLILGLTIEEVITVYSGLMSLLYIINIFISYSLSKGFILE